MQNSRDPDVSGNDSRSGDHGQFSVIAVIHAEADPMAGFAHALRLVCAARGELEVVDLRRHHRHHEGPGIRTTLQQWSMLSPGASRDDVGRLGIRVKRSVKEGDSRRELDKELGRSSRDLLVMGTPRRTAFDALFGRDLTDYLARTFRQTTLYVPEECRPLVDPLSGEVSLKRVLVPIDGAPGAVPALVLLKRLLSFFPGENPTLIGVHLGDTFPPIAPALLEGLCWEARTIARSADSIAHQLALIADSELADLIVMSTNGRDTLGEKLLGSITEQVLRRAPCPLLAVAV